MVLDGIRDQFAGHFISGLQAMLPNDPHATTISNRQQLRDNIDRIWANIPTEQRRPIALCIWSKHLLPHVNSEWHIEPGSAENNLNIKELMLRRKAPNNDAFRYSWLQNQQGSILAALKGGLFKLRIEFGIEGRLNNPERISRGDLLSLGYHATNPLAFELSVWLGSSLERNGQYFYHTDEDAQVSLQPGQHTYKRFLTISQDWPAANYNLEGQIWYGFRSDPSRSIALVQSWEQHLQIIDAPVAHISLPAILQSQQIHSKGDMPKNTDESMVPSGSNYARGTLSKADVPEVPDHFDEGIIREHLARIADSALLDQYVQRLRNRFTTSNQRAIIDHYISLYKKGSELVQARVKLQSTAHEGVIKQKELEVKLAELEANQEEHLYRKDKAVYKRQNVNREFEQPESSPGQNEEAKMEAARQRYKRDIRFKVDLKAGKRPYTVAALQQWRKEELVTIHHDATLSPSERIERCDAVEDAYQQEMKRLDRDINIFEDE